MTLSERRQLALDLGFDDARSFATWVDDGSSGEVRAALGALAAAGQGRLHLWGPRGSGRSHLLEATARAAAEAGREVACLRLAEGVDAPAEARLLGGRAECLVIDDIDAVVGAPEWEEVLLGLWEDQHAVGGAFLTSAVRSPPALGCRLPDLGSRLAAGLVLRLPLPDDAHKAAVLEAAARRRGLALEPGVTALLLRRAPRDLGALLRLLARLDRDSMAVGRRPGTGFVAAWLDGVLGPQGAGADARVEGRADEER